MEVVEDMPRMRCHRSYSSSSLRSAIVASMALASTVLPVGAAISTVAAEPLGPTLRRVPAFEAPLLDGQGSVRLTDLKGKVVLLSFWASWCGPCRYEMPLFQQLYDRFHEDGLEVVAVAVFDQRAKALEFHRRHAFTFTVLFDATGEVAKAYDLVGPPTTFLVGRDGELIEIPDPQSGDRQLSVYDPTIWTHADTYSYLERVLAR